MSDMSMNSLEVNEMKNHQKYSMAGSSLFGFVIVTLIVFMCLVFFKPDYVMRKRDCEPTDEVDCMTALLYAVGITVLLAIVIALIVYLFSC